jgi:hypothetical protein
MPKQKNRLSDMDYDEVSTVGKGANADSLIVIAKRAPEEEEMPQMDIYNEAGDLLDMDKLEDGDVVFDAEGNQYVFNAEAEDENEDENELATVGKSAFLDNEPKTGGFSEEILKALTGLSSDEERDQVIAKALGRVEEVEKALAKQTEIAKAERDARLTKDYVAKAAEYNVPVDPRELGPVLYRMAETMSFEDCSVIAKCLETAGEMLFQEVGFKGSGDNADPMAVIEGLSAEIGKSADGKGPSLEEILDSNPQAYDEYLRDQRTRF